MRLTFNIPMKRSVHIQRLKRPTRFPNPYATGAGPFMLPTDLGAIFSLDYMGFAEFEFDAFPNAIEFLQGQARLRGLVSGNYQGVWYITPALYEPDVKAFISQLLTNERPLKLIAKCGLAKALEDPELSKIVGWLELNNGFFFFVDRDMFEKSKQFLGM